MKKLTFIDHSFHRKTKSSDFFKNILKKKFIISELWDDSWRGGKKIGSKEINEIDPDTVLFWQIPPRVKEIKKIKTKNIIYVPMEDAFFYDDYKWLIYKKFNIKVLCFSKRVYNQVSKLGIQSFYSQYFPTPQESIINKKNTNGIKIYFWQRRNEINWHIIKTIIGNQKVEKIIFKNEPDPFVVKSISPNEEDKKKYNITSVSEWLSEEELKKIYQECNIYFAPRKYEGIGMSFLEAMSYGMIVIAPNTPTHNEYIVSGYNGYLYNFKKTTEIKFEKLDEMINNVVKTVESGYKNWLDSIDKIINFIEEETQQIYLNNKEKFIVFVGNISKKPFRELQSILKIIIKKILWKILYK